MTSNLNNAATMSVDDYFTMNMYHGKIYKTTNMLGKTLAQYCSNDSALSAEQKKIDVSWLHSSGISMVIRHVVIVSIA